MVIIWEKHEAGDQTEIHGPNHNLPNSEQLTFQMSGDF